MRFACHGGCPKDRFTTTPDGFTTTPDGEPGLHYLCPSYKAFFGHIRPAMDAMCQLLRAGRAPSELVNRYAAEDSRRGRNDPCPCGSGRKWKRCHRVPLPDDVQMNRHALAAGVVDRVCRDDAYRVIT